jgi:hypothetical protein
MNGKKGKMTLAAKKFAKSRRQITAVCRQGSGVDLSFSVWLDPIHSCCIMEEGPYVMGNRSQAHLNIYMSN